MKRTIIDKNELKAAMHSAGFATIEQLSRASGVSRPTFYNMMRGNFNTGKLDRIAATLGVSPLSLLAEEETANVVIEMVTPAPEAAAVAA